MVFDVQQSVMKQHEDIWIATDIRVKRSSLARKQVPYKCFQRGGLYTVVVLTSQSAQSSHSYSIPYDESHMPEFKNSNNSCNNFGIIHALVCFDTHDPG